MALSAEFPSPIEVDWRAEVNAVPEGMGAVADNFFQYFFDGFVITPDRRRNASNLLEAFKKYKNVNDGQRIQDLSLKDLRKRSLEQIEYHKQRFIGTRGDPAHRMEVKKWDSVRQSVDLVAGYARQTR